jgi:hypothetical protein
MAGVDCIMICPGTTMGCDNVGCRRGGCQGRLPELPLFQARRTQAIRPTATQVQPAPVVLLHPRAEQPQSPDQLAA